MPAIGLPELTEEQLQTLCEIAEETIKRYVVTKVGQSRVSQLDILVEAEGSKPTTISVDIDLQLTGPFEGYVKTLVDEAAENAFEQIEQWLRDLSCRFNK